MATLIDVAMADDRGFRTAEAAFEAALGRHPERLSTHDLTLAGQPVHLRVLGPKLAADLEATFRHLRCATATAHGASTLRIDVWHGAECPGFFDRGSLPPMPSAYGTLEASADHRYVAENREHSAVHLDRREARIVAWIQSRDRLHLDERARPFHRAVAIAMSDRGIQFAHAGLVAADGRGALIVGKGGSGKSTSSLACLMEGMDYLGDDFVGIAPGSEGGHRGFGLYASAVVGLGHTARYPELEAAARPGNHGHEVKSLLDVAALGRGRLLAEVEIAALVLPTITGQAETRFRPAGLRDGLLALAPSSLLLAPGAGNRALERLTRLVAGLPCFWLELGPNLGQIAPAMRRLILSLELGP